MPTVSNRPETPHGAPGRGTTAPEGRPRTGRSRRGADVASTHRGPPARGGDVRWPGGRGCAGSSWVLLIAFLAGVFGLPGTRARGAAGPGGDHRCPGAGVGRSQRLADAQPVEARRERRGRLVVDAGGAARRAGHHVSGRRVADGVGRAAGRLSRLRAARPGHGQRGARLAEPRRVAGAVVVPGPDRDAGAGGQGRRRPGRRRGPGSGAGRSRHFRKYHHLRRHHRRPRPHRPPAHRHRGPGDLRRVARGRHERPRQGPGRQPPPTRRSAPSSPRSPRRRPSWSGASRMPVRPPICTSPWPPGPSSRRAC